MVNQQLLNNLGINEAAVENLNPISLSLINSLLLTIQEQAEELKVNQQQLLNYQVQVQGIKSQLERRKPRRLSLGNELTAEFTTINISPSSVSFSPHTPRSLNTPTISELGEIVEIVQQQEEVLEDSATQIITELQTQQESLQQQLQSLTQQLAQKESDLARSENQRQAKIAETAKLEQQISKLKTELTTRETELVDAETELTCISEDLSQAEEEKEKIKKYYLDALLKEKNARLELEKKLTHEITENQRLKNYQEETNTNLTTALNQLTELQRITHEERLELQQLIDEQEARYQAEKNEREIAFKKQMDNMRLFQLTAIREVNQAHPSQSNASLPTSLSNSPRHSICEENFTPRKNQTPLYFELLRKGNFFGSNEVEERRSSISSVMTNHSQLDKVFEEVLALTDLETETNQGCNSEEHQRLVAELTALEASTQELNAELLS
ncbi:8400_t:CDS:1 [Ambispora leptoticha]|uniref:8400_t:CDS:1 n=1 Tax=Ambispora leptoticha TaxID=144679 RepID=A0A9N8YK48_9GLOM|nr:8400_t:CDS:1 [Ambispora leptoticha]